MKNIIIFGSGRSGTSMTAGIFRKAGYHMGTALYPPDHRNPKGFFESWDINGVNEELLDSVILNKPSRRYSLFDKHGLRRGQKWLSALPIHVMVTSNHASRQKIQLLTAQKPFCYKDPRFSYTLPAWLPFLDHVALICVFREPERTAASIVKECRDAKYLKSVRMDFDRAIGIWLQNYQYVLYHYSARNDLLFVHFDQLLTDQGLDRIAAFTDAPIDRTFPDVSLKRSKIKRFTNQNAVRATYRELCAKAGYNLK